MHILVPACANIPTINGEPTLSRRISSCMSLRQRMTPTPIRSSILPALDETIRYGNSTENIAWPGVAVNSTKGAGPGQGATSPGLALRADLAMPPPFRTMPCKSCQHSYQSTQLLVFQEKERDNNYCKRACSGSFQESDAGARPPAGPFFRSSRRCRPSCRVRETRRGSSVATGQNHSSLANGKRVFSDHATGAGADDKTYSYILSAYIIYRFIHFILLKK
jgi:hypothetical protein